MEITNFSFILGEEKKGCFLFVRYCYLAVRGLLLICKKKEYLLRYILFFDLNIL